MLSLNQKTSGFTLMELMIVIAIIVILLGFSMFPYGYYMQRSYTERAADWIGQEWVLAHKAIRGWIEFDPLANKHARMLLVFEKGKSEIQSYLLSGAQLPNLASLPTDPNTIIKYKKFIMENGVEIVGFSWSILGPHSRVWYIIYPPYADGKFYTWTTEAYMTWAIVIVGYPGAGWAGGRTREVLLRPYLK